MALFSNLLSRIWGHAEAAPSRAEHGEDPLPPLQPPAAPATPSLIPAASAPGCSCRCGRGTEQPGGHACRAAGLAAFHRGPAETRGPGQQPGGPQGTRDGPGVYRGAGQVRGDESLAPQRSHEEAGRQRRESAAGFAVLRAKVATRVEAWCGGGRGKRYGARDAPCGLERGAHCTPRMVSRSRYECLRVGTMRRLSAAGRE